MPIAIKPGDNISAVFGFLKNEKLTDCFLTAEGNMIRAHKLILAASSKYFEDLFTLIEDKHPVIVLKDISIKNVLLLLEFIYLGKVELEDEDVAEFKEAAKLVSIKVEFEEPPVQEESMSEDLLTEINDQEMQSSSSDHTMEPDEDSEDDEPPPLKLKISKVVSERKFEDSSEAHKKGPPSKKRKNSSSDPDPSKKLPLYLQLNPCLYCDNKMKEKDRRYHQKFCWKNPNRITSNCQHCPKKFQVPGKLKLHMNQQHPELTVE